MFYRHAVGAVPLASADPKERAQMVREVLKAPGVPKAIAVT